MDDPETDRYQSIRATNRRTFLAGIGGVTALPVGSASRVDPNQQPVVSLRVTPPTPAVGNEVFFDASESTDEDGTIEAYEWDFDGDGETDVTGEVVRRTFSDAGNHTIRLTVEDDDGARRTVERTVSVDGPNDAATFDYSPSEPSVGASVSFDATELTDKSVASYEWDFTNDGTTDATGDAAGHVYTEPGIYTVTLTVTYDDDETVTVRRAFRVNAAPKAEFSVSPSEPILGEPAEFDARASADPDGAIEQYQWDFTDDGSFAESGAVVSHTFDSHGQFPVTLRVNDETGTIGTTSKTLSTRRAAEFTVTGETTTVGVREPAVVSVEARNLLGDEPLFARIDLSLPDSVFVADVRNGLYGGNGATQLFEVPTETTETVDVVLESVAAGEFGLTGTVEFFVGDRNPPRHDRTVEPIQLTVTDGGSKSTDTTTDTTTESDTATATETVTDTATATDTTTANTPTESPTATETPTATPLTHSPTETPTATPTTTATAPPTSESVESTVTGTGKTSLGSAAGTTGSTDASTPGLGVVAGLSGLFGAGGVALWRRFSGDGGDSDRENED